jgi:hypothetical protein
MLLSGGTSPLLSLRVHRMGDTPPGTRDLSVDTQRALLSVAVRPESARPERRV